MTKKSIKPTGKNDSSLLHKTADDTIVGYLTEMIVLQEYENTITSRKYGIVCSAMMDKNFLEKFNNIKSKLESVDPAIVRSYLCECILNRLPLTHILESIDNLIVIKSLRK